MGKSFLEHHPPRVDWDRLRQGPTQSDIEATPPASIAEWEQDGYLVYPLRDEAVRKPGQPATRNATRKKTASS